jgi:glucose-1-phosphate cytidylyltransferase
MKIYEHAGIRDFIICGGYKVQVIIEYFVNYRLHNASVEVNLKDGSTRCLNSPHEDWRVTIVNTGNSTMTGGRLKRVADLLDDSEPFCMTYGDGVIDANIADIIAFHKSQHCQATMTAVRMAARFGAAEISGNRVTNFVEKPVDGEGRINGGFFVLEKSVLDLVADDDTFWEKEPLEALARQGQLAAYHHDGFWQPMDTLRDRRLLEDLWEQGKAPWKRWR